MSLTPETDRRASAALLRLVWDRPDGRRFVTQTPVPWTLLDDRDALSVTVNSMREAALKNITWDNPYTAQVVEPGFPYSDVHPTVADRVTDLVPGEDFTHYGQPRPSQS